MKEKDAKVKGSTYHDIHLPSCLELALHMTDHYEYVRRTGNFVKGFVRMMFARTYMSGVPFAKAQGWLAARPVNVLDDLLRLNV